MGRELEMFYILIFQWVCWQILFAFWSEHVFRLDMYNSAICQVLVERDTERERQTDTLSVIHTQTHTHTERQAHREREMEWLVKVAEGSNEIGAA